MTEEEIEEWAFWWLRFLELNDDYFIYGEYKDAGDEQGCKDIEEMAGKGNKLAELFTDFGPLWKNRFSDTNDPVWKNWFAKKRHYFVDEKINVNVIEVKDHSKYTLKNGHILIDIPLSMTKADIYDQVTKLLRQHKRSENEPEIIPAKYQLYRRKGRSVTIDQVRSAYLAWTNDTKTIAEHVAAYGLGPRTDVGEELRKLLGMNMRDIKDAFRRQMLKGQLLSYKNSYGRYRDIGNQYSVTTAYGMFPCTVAQLDEELRR
jgi:hypothetical protein